MRNIAAIIVVAGLLLIGMLFAINRLGLPKSKVWVGESHLYPNGMREFSMLSNEETEKLYQAHKNEIEPFLTAPCHDSVDLEKCLTETILSALENIPRSKDTDLAFVRKSAEFIASFGGEAERRRTLAYVETLPSPLTVDDDERVVRLLKIGACRPSVRGASKIPAANYYRGR